MTFLLMMAGEIDGGLAEWGRKSLDPVRAATIPARGKPMSNLANVVQQLQKEREQARRTVEQLDEALKALGSLGGLRGRVGGAQSAGKKRRTMSAAARKRIAAAQRARWAKWKAARRNK